MRRRESRRRSRHNRTSKSPAMWPGFLAAQIVREYSLLLIFLCKIFPEKLDKARGGRRGILDSPFQSTPPARGATAARSVPDMDYVCISIHAPREGGDKSRTDVCAYDGRFQSTPPARGATIALAPAFMASMNFNPRPPRGGRPGRDGISRMFTGSFQSTPPARGRRIIYMYSL